MMLVECEGMYKNRADVCQLKKTIIPIAIKAKVLLGSEDDKRSWVLIPKLRF